MILRLEQVMRRARRYIFRNEGNVFGSGSVPEPGCAVFDLFGRKFSVSHSGRNAVIYEIKSKDTQVIVAGNVENRFVETNRILFFPIGYNYFELFFEGSQYRIFENNHGNGEVFFCVWEGSGTTAMLKQDDVTMDKPDAYTIYAGDDKSLLAAAAFGMYLEVTLYAATHHSLLQTRQTALLDKYDPEFIPRIINERRDAL